MYDMHQSGAIAFSDGLQPVQQAGLLVKALQYVKAMNAVVIQLPDDHTIQPNGLMNEGIVSTRLGLPGKPALAEELMTARDLKLAAYAASRLHLTAVSTATSIDYIRHARQSGTDITCSATPYHTFFTDSDLAGYDTHFKVNPPLRNEQDRTALRNAFEDGTVDCIATHHLPHETDSKVVEFEYARFGMIGLETAFAACRTAMPELALDKLIACLATNPRRIFGLDPATIKEDAVACLTLFEPDTTWTVTRESLGSKSSNTPFLGNALKGKVTGTVRNGKVHLNA
jgi:dihydroorotase